MNPFSPAFNEESRKIHSAMLKALASVGQKPTAEALGVDEATVSRYKSGHFQFFALLLAHIGLTVVSVKAKVYDPDYMKALEVLAARGIAHREGDTITGDSE